MTAGKRAARSARLSVPVARYSSPTPTHEEGCADRPHDEVLVRGHQRTPVAAHRDQHIGGERRNLQEDEHVERIAGCGHAEQPRQTQRVHRVEEVVLLFGNLRGDALRTVQRDDEPDQRYEEQQEGIRGIDAVLDAPWRRPVTDRIRDNLASGDLREQRCRNRRRDDAHADGDAPRKGRHVATGSSAAQQAAAGPPAGSEDAPPSRSILRAGRCDRRFVLFENLVFFDRVVGFANAHDQCETERQGRHADHDRGEDQDVRQRVRIDLELVGDDRGGAREQFCRRDVQQIDGGLENTQADELLESSCRVQSRCTAPPSR